nr:uncharacterized protein LOC117691724 isoform X3 [Crassostrea gigas]
MFKTRVPKIHPCLRILMMCIILHGKVKTLVAGSNSCEVTRSTVQVVNGCPDSEESWREAAVRKNCDVHAKQCSEPEKLVYHCVINLYINQMLEVCAYAQNILGGKCTSYSSSGNVIQENWITDCSKFKENACPPYYRSDVAYKYQGCYQLIKKSTAGTNNSVSTRNPDNVVVFTTTVFTTTSANISSNMSTNKHVKMSGKEEKMDSNLIVIPIVVTVLLAIIIGLVVIVIRKRKGKKRIRRQSLEKPNAEGEDTLLSA